MRCLRGEEKRREEGEKERRERGKGEERKFYYIKGKLI